MPLTERSSLYRLIEKQLGEPLADYVAARRASMSWRDLATELSKQVGVEVSYETLRLWFSEAAPTATTTAA